MSVACIESYKQIFLMPNIYRFIVADIASVVTDVSAAITVSVGDG